MEVSRSTNRYRNLSPEKKAEFKKRSVERATKQRAINRQYIVDYLFSHGCSDCPITDPVVLEFDHLRDKECVVPYLMNHSLERLKEEISKCEVVCANCHRRRTSKRSGNWYKALLTPKKVQAKVSIQ